MMHNLLKMVPLEGFEPSTYRLQGGWFIVNNNDNNHRLIDRGLYLSDIKRPDITHCNIMGCATPKVQLLGRKARKSQSQETVMTGTKGGTDGQS